MKQLRCLILALLMVIAPSACQRNTPAEPQVSQMRAICELATMDCYYHNVAKYKAEDVEGILWFKKDEHFWIEYAGQVTLGIDATLVTMEVRGDRVTVTIPPAEVLGCKVDETSLTKDSFIVARGSADITAEDEIAAFREAQEHMRSAAASDTVLLANAQRRAQTLLEDYIRNISKSTGIQYQIAWVYVDERGTPVSQTSGNSTEP